MKTLAVVLIASCVALMAAALPHKLEGVRIEERLGNVVPASPATFRDESGKTVDFSTFLDGRRPVILVIAFFNCPMLCGLVAGAVVNGANDMSLTAGGDYRIITVSMDPKDKSPDAAKMGQRYRALLKNSTGDPAWVFLTGETPEIRKVTDAAGFHYRYDPSSGEYLHAAGIFVLTPQGKVSRVFTGALYRGFDLKLALIEAKEGIQRTATEHFLLYCYQYNPKNEGYGFKAMVLMRLGGALVVLALVLLFILLSRSKKTKAA